MTKSICPKFTNLKWPKIRGYTSYVGLPIFFGDIKVNLLNLHSCYNKWSVTKHFFLCIHLLYNTKLAIIARWNQQIQIVPIATYVIIFGVHMEWVAYFEPIVQSLLENNIFLKFNLIIMPKYTLVKYRLPHCGSVNSTLIYFNTMSL